MTTKELLPFIQDYPGITGEYSSRRRARALRSCGIDVRYAS